jgi:hypothetical protein
MKDIDEIWGSEVHLYMPGKYAGTSDMTGLYKGRPAIIDFKQTIYYSVVHPLQGYGGDCSTSPTTTIPKDLITSAVAV